MIPVAEFLPLLGSRAVVLAGPVTGRVSVVRGVAGSPAEVGRTITDADDAVVLLSPLERFDARFDVLLRRAATSGVPLLVVAPEDDAPPMGAGTAALADRLGVTVVGAADPWAASVRLHELIGTGDAPAARAALAAARVGLDAGPALEDLFTRLEAELGHALRFLDASGRALRGAAVAPSTAALLARTSGTSEPVWASDDQGETVVAVPVPTGIGARAWLAVGLTAPLRAERATVATALRVAAVATGHRLVLTRLDDERDARYRMAMLDDLRAADGAPAPALVQRTIAAGWRLDAWHVGIRLVAARGSGEAVDAVALRGAVESAFATHDLTVTVVEQADGWALWTSADEELDQAAVAALAAGARAAQNTLRQAVDTNVGVGSVHAGPAGLLRTLGEAGDAVRLAAARPESGWFVHVDRLGLAQLLLAWTQTDTFLPAAEQLLAPLERGGGALRETLAAYLDAESSIAETAAVLGVHRNTVADRIDRVERRLRVDLSDPETRLALHLATRALGGA